MKRLPSRRAYLEKLAPKAEGRIVVCCLGGASRLWAGICPSPSNFLLTDYMGLAIPLALGMAVAQPKKQVIVMEGDGGLLMKMESLVTAAAKAPPNLLVLTFFNGAYVATGGQPLPAAKGIELEDFAKAARFPQTATVDSPQGFEAALERMLDSGRLSYVNLLTAADSDADFKADARPRPLDMRIDFTRWIKENCRP